MTNDASKSETYSEAEAEARREAALQVMFKTPHKPHKNPTTPKRRRERSGNKSKQG